LKRIGHIRGPWHAGQITLDFRVSCQTVFKVLFLSRHRRRQVGDFITLHDTQPRRNCADRLFFGLTVMLGLRLLGWTMRSANPLAEEAAPARNAGWWVWEGDTDA
jgi:hypothetical protein